MQIVNSYEHDVRNGQRQLLLRVDDYYGYSALPREAIDKLFALLREISLSVPPSNDS